MYPNIEYAARPSIHLDSIALCVGSPLGTSDHCSLLAFLDLTPPRCLRAVRRKIWMYSKADFEGLNDDIMDNLDLTGLEESGDDAIWSEFKNDFLYRASKFIPHKMASCRKFPPWMCKSILCKIQARDRAHKAARRLGMQSAWSAYRCRRNRVWVPCDQRSMNSVTHWQVSSSLQEISSLSDESLQACAI